MERRPSTPHDAPALVRVGGAQSWYDSVPYMDGKGFGGADKTANAYQVFKSDRSNYSFGILLSQKGFIGLPWDVYQEYPLIAPAHAAASLWWKTLAVSKDESGHKYVSCIPELDNTAVFDTEEEALRELAAVLEREAEPPPLRWPKGALVPRTRTRTLMR